MSDVIFFDRSTAMCLDGRGWMFERPVSVGYTIPRSRRLNLKSQWYHGESHNTCKVSLTPRSVVVYPMGAAGILR